MARMLELAFKLKQFATGMPSEIKETHTHVTGKVSVEWEAAIRKAYGVVDVEAVETRSAELGTRNADESYACELSSLMPYSQMMCEAGTPRPCVIAR